MALDLTRLKLFEKKEGREETRRLFWRYIKDFVCLGLIPLIGIFVVNPLDLFMMALGDMIILTLFFMHVRLSMRIRRLEERTECQRYV